MEEFVEAEEKGEKTANENSKMKAPQAQILTSSSPRALAQAPPCMCSCLHGCRMVLADAALFPQKQI